MKNLREQQDEKEKSKLREEAKARMQKARQVKNKRKSSGVINDDASKRLIHSMKKIQIQSHDESYMADRSEIETEFHSFFKRKT